MTAVFSHISVGSADLGKAALFYDAVLSCLGLQRRQVISDGGPGALCWIIKDTPLPRFYVRNLYDGGLATAGNGTMVSFMASSPAEVDQGYAAGLAAGGTCDGVPGERVNYGRGYYGAYLRDPDGNKIHLVHRGDIAL